MKVYVITQGEYSDYHICGVAIDAERAEVIKKHFDNGWDKPNIEEYDTEAYESENLLTEYVIIISRSGDVVEFRYDFPVADASKYKNNYKFNNKMEFIADITAKDKDHALKIALDKRAKMLAEQLLV